MLSKTVITLLTSLDNKFNTDTIREKSWLRNDKDQFYIKLP